MNNNIIIIGAGGHAKVVIDCVEQENKFYIDAIVDDNYKNRTIFDFVVQQKDNEGKYDGKKVIIAIGNCITRQKIAQDLSAEYVTTIHPTASISKYAKIGIGSQIFATAVINAGAEIGNHVIVNTGAIIEHDCKVEDFVHLSPNCCLGGEVTVGTGTHIGIGATVIQGVAIGSNVIIGAGAVVISDVPDNCTAVGIPAKPIKYHL